MPEIRPDMSDESRCVVTHWKLPVQCVLSPTHRDDHEAWHPESGNRIRFCGESVSPYTRELHHGEWVTLYEPPITDLATAVEVMGALPMPAGPAQPATPRWHQLRTELIATFSDYMPVTAATKAVDLLDEVITEALLEGTAEIRRLKDELERRTEDLAFLERTTLPDLRRTVQRHEDGKKRWRDRAEKAEGERDALQERLHQIALTKVWTNEDRKQFVFVEDIAGPLFGIEPKEAGR